MELYYRCSPVSQHSYHDVILRFIFVNVCGCNLPSLMCTYHCIIYILDSFYSSLPLMDIREVFGFFWYKQWYHEHFCLYPMWMCQNHSGVPIRECLGFKVLESCNRVYKQQGLPWLRNRTNYLNYFGTQLELAFEKIYLFVSKSEIQKE